MVRGVSLWLGPGVLRVETASAWSDPRQVTADVARAELGRARANVEDLLGDTRFKELVGDRVATYELVNDYGTGTLLICTLRGDELDWPS